MISLIDKVGIWHGMPQDTAEQMVWADNYYDSELIPLAQKSFCLRYEEQAQGADYYGMFILLGDDWAKSAFIVRLLAPQNIHILYQKHHARASRGRPIYGVRSATWPLISRAAACSQRRRQP